MLNSVVLIGNMVREIELYTGGKTNTAKFTLAVQRNIKNKDGNYDVDFINCVAFGKTADLLNNYTAKGSRLAVQGRIQTGSYMNKESKKVYTTDVIVSEINLLTKLEKPQDDTPAPEGFNHTNDPLPIDDLDLPF
jgi:single-strand DNA-binding protein